MAKYASSLLALALTTAGIAASPLVRATSTPCDGIEKSACLARVEKLLDAGQVGDAIAGLSLLCTSRGDPEGCVGAATLLAKQNRGDRAKSLLARACTSTINAGCDLLANLLLASAEYDAAASAYDRACAQSEETACERADRVRAIIVKRKELSTSCNAGEPEPCAKLAALDRTSREPPVIAPPGEPPVIAPPGGTPASASAPASTTAAPDPTMTPEVLAKIKAIRARHESDAVAASAEINRLCENGEGYACVLVSSEALIEGRAVKAKYASETGCREKSASSCFVRYSIAKGENDESQAEQYFSLTCRYGGLKYCADARRRLGAPEQREPAQQTPPLK